MAAVTFAAASGLTGAALRALPPGVCLARIRDSGVTFSGPVFQGGPSVAMRRLQIS